ncbi:cation diffusion facilitator family transporter [Pseudarthrobacter phenanthrenivorans]|jgi:cobalt-zinc-cadmium efflux system protein|uniref:Cation transporter n=1 Tax=Pseudarthrobacter phenanthrenivorans TaxID=361575 RepID=A0A0B4DTN2_PSEPS|nr:cation diffusion facilitator family transporter [Pseudarthrobacter phenanthrenivorans]KIC67780.1 cation transporter [Pseudarthrobacter phenanthrenivorans]
MGHDHSHGITGTRRHRKRLVAVLGITLGVVVIQTVGAILSGSLSLLADAGHMLSDAAGVTIALMAAWIAGRPASDQRTYGFQRAEVLAALANALILIVISAVIFTEAVRRFSAPPLVQTDIMLFAAILGAAANLASLLVLRTAQEESLNIRGAYLEVLGDLLGSLAVIAAAAVIKLTGFQAADTIASVLIALMILPRAWSLLRDVVDVLLEATPKGVEVQMIREHILSVAGVTDVHDIHIWTITSGVPVFSAHVVVDDGVLNARGADQLLDKLISCLGSHFDTDHCTFQLEPASHSEHEANQHA